MYPRYGLILILSITITSLALLGLLKADPLKPLTAEDLHILKRIGSPEISPDGNYIVYSVRKWNQGDGSVNTYLEYINLQTNQTFALTDPNTPFSDSNPAFSVNFPGFLLFLSSRTGSNQIYIAAFPPTTESQIPIQFTNFDVDVNNMRWKANTVTFTAEVFSVCSDLKCTADKNAELATDTAQYKYDRNGVTIPYSAFVNLMEQESFFAYMDKIKTVYEAKEGLINRSSLDDGYLDEPIENPDAQTDTNNLSRGDHGNEEEEEEEEEEIGKRKSSKRKSVRTLSDNEEDIDDTTLPPAKTGRRNQKK